MANSTQIIPAQHSEHLSKALYALTINPAKDILYYFAPFIEAWWRGYYPMVCDPSQEAMMPCKDTELALKEIQDLTAAAKLPRSVIAYVGMHHHFSSSGGKFSLSKPALLIPDQAVFRKGENPPFGKDPEYPGTKWIFSDKEVKFLLAKELAHIHMNNSLLRIAIKVAVVSAIITVFSTPMSGALATAILAAAIGTYLFSERFFQSLSDCKAIDILKSHNMQNPKDAAIGALEKIREQNLYFRDNSFLAKLYISSSGNNYLDLLHPALSKRIESLRAIA